MRDPRREQGRSLRSLRRGPAPARRDAPIRSHTQRELGRARRYLEVLRTAYLVGAVLLSIPLGLFAFATNWAPLPTVLLLATAGCFVAGIRVYQEPRFWTVFAAMAATAVTLGFVLLSLALVGGIGLFHLWCGVITAAFWVGIGQGRKAASLSEANPDLFAARMMRGEVPRSRGLREAAAARHQQAWTVAAIVGGCLVVGIGLLVWSPWEASEAEGESYVAAEPPPPIDGTLARFADAWSRSDIAAINALRFDDRRERQAVLFQRILKRRGWEKALPPLTSSPSIREDSLRRRIVYHSFAGLPDDPPMTTHWEYEDSKWGLSNMSFARE